MTPSHTFFQRLQIVRQIPIFSRLNWFDAQKVARKAAIVEYKKGDLISREGAPADYFYSVISGRVQAFQSNERGQQINVEFVHRGMHFGIISALTGENHSQSFVALNDSVVLRITREELEKILQTVPQLGIELSQNLSRRIHKRRQGGKGVFESLIISVYSPVGGTGGSTYAVNLALSLVKETRKRILFIEIKTRPCQENHPGPTPAVRWKIPAVNLRDIAGDDTKIHSNIHRDDCGVDVMRVGLDADEPLAAREISPFISALVGEYHYVVVDLPSEMDDVVMEALTQSDQVHLITFDQSADLQMARKVIDGLEGALRESFQIEKIRVIVRSREEKAHLLFEEIDRSIDYGVYQMLPFVSAEDQTGRLDSSCFEMRLPPPQNEYLKAVRHIAREIGKVRVGIALGGGAALGIAHVGVIKVLEEENIPVDVIVGSSMGALVGALWATGKTVNEMQAIAAEFKGMKEMLRLFDPVFPVSGIIGGRAIRRWLKKHLGNSTFYSTRIPLKVVAYDLRRRQEIVINSGSIADAVRQSIAIPGVIEPVIQDDRVIIDGGVLNPLPTNVLGALGITKIIAVNVLQSPEHVSRGFDIQQHKLRNRLDRPFGKNPLSFVGLRAGRALHKLFSPSIPDIIVQTLQASEYVIAEQSARQADVVICPDLLGLNWYELNKYDALIKSGEDAARASLAGIKQLVEME
jgi:predicted acylesterase/phospholipase RssA/cellulose biosynthesis protein BcsQ